MSTRWARVARGTLAACFAVFVAALFHAAMGGGVPSGLAITLSLAFAVPACVLLAGRRITRGRSGLWRQVLSVALSQFILHALFSLQPGTTAVGSARAIDHMHAGAQLAMTADSTASVHGSNMAGLHESPLMWVGHASAVVITVAAMRYGERTVRQLVATTAIRIVAFVKRFTLVPVRTAAAVQRAADARPVILPAPRILIGRMRHRGPPAGVLTHA